MNLITNFVKARRILLRGNPNLNEFWVQTRIAEDPTILGLGDLVLRDRERIQPRAGRLDLLLQDRDSARRYEVEVQLGATDEGHIIRAIEYWDLERKRYPQYDHCAVLIAEDVTSRFLNVISLFNGTIPLMAIQMQAIEVAGNLTLVFSTVADVLTRGVVDEDEDAEAAPTDRAYWEQKASTASLRLIDELLKLCQNFDPSVKLKYNKFYIGLARDGMPFNFVVFRPKKSFVKLELKLPRTDDLDNRIASQGLDSLDYDVRWGNYRLRLTEEDIRSKSDVIRGFIGEAHAMKVL